MTSERNLNKRKYILILTVIGLLGSSLFLQVKLCFANPEDGEFSPSDGALIVPDQYKTIQSAIDSAKPCDMIFVRSGTYNVDYITGGDVAILINKPISLIGENNKNTIIHGADARDAQAVIGVVSDNVTISGFTVTGYAGTEIGLWDYGEYNGVNPSGVEITDNIIIANKSAGISTNEGTNNTIARNLIRQASFGIIVSSSDTSIIGNTITDCDIGVQFSSCHDIILQANMISNNGFSTNAGEFGGLLIGPNASDLKIFENRIQKNRDFGINFNDFCRDSNVYSNNITDNGVGVKVSNFLLWPFAPEVGNGNSVFNNNLINNTANAVVESAYPPNLLLMVNQSYNGQVIGNGTNVVSWDNGYFGNYWSDYTPQSQVASTSGIGSASYTINENNIDHYPLISKINIYAINLGSTDPKTATDNFHIDSFVVITTIIIALLFVLTGIILGKRRKR